MCVCVCALTAQSFSLWIQTDKHMVHIHTSKSMLCFIQQHLYRFILTFCCARELYCDPSEIYHFHETDEWDIDYGKNYSGVRKIEHNLFWMSVWCSKVQNLKIRCSLSNHWLSLHWFFPFETFVLDCEHSKICRLKNYQFWAHFKLSFYVGSSLILYVCV